MTSNELANHIAGIASERKALDIVVLDLKELASFTDHFVICSGSSERQVSAVADSIYCELKQKGHMPLGMEGSNQGMWALIDYGDVVVHVFHEEMREYYQLEDMWLDAPRHEITS